MKTIDNSADVIFSALAEGGADHVFLVPGDDPNMHHAIDKFCRPIVMRDERAAAFAAQLYGRLGPLGVCATSHGPGMANLLTGLAAARLEHDPVIAVSSQFPSANCETFGHAYVSEQTLAPVTKNVLRVNAPEAAGSSANAAIAEARALPEGPVSIILPQDVSNGLNTARAASAAKANAGSAIDEKKIAAAARAIDEAGEVLVIVGAGPARAGQLAALHDMLAKWNACAVTTIAGKGSLGARGDFTVSRHNLARLIGAMEFGAAVMIGVDVSEGLAAPSNIKKLISIRTGDHQVGGGDVIEGDMGAILTALARHNVKAKSGAGEVAKHFATPKHPIEFAARASSAFEGPIVVDTGLYKHAWATHCAANDANKVIVTNGLSSIGWSLGAALGAAVATQKPTLAITGDGGFSMSCSEMFAFMQHDLPVSVVVVRDNAYGMIKRLEQERTKANSRAIELSGPDLSKLAGAFGFEHVRLEKEQDYALLAKPPARRTLFEVPVDYADYVFSHK